MFTRTSLKEKRGSSAWYKVAHRMSEENLYNLFNPAYSSHDNWDAVWENMENKNE